MRNSDPTRCWACLGPLTDENIVKLSRDIRVPCCRECWSQIPVSVRLTIGREQLKLPHDVAAADATRDGWMQVREFFRAAQAGELQRISPFEVGESLN